MAQTSAMGDGGQYRGDVGRDGRLAVDREGGSQDPASQETQVDESSVAWRGGLSFCVRRRQAAGAEQQASEGAIGGGMMEKQQSVLAGLAAVDSHIARRGERSLSAGEYAW